VALPVILKNLMGELDGKPMSRLVKEIDGMATYFCELGEEVAPDKIQSEVADTMERLGVQPENKMVTLVLVEYVAESCRAAALLNR
jgi:hypothetical protein